MPYFYAEDEAHHFNRTVEMVKEGRYNPQYFHKPSLHFYLRMPVVALAYLWSAQRGHLNSVQEIETRNSFGLAGYQFTASHPGIVKWNRAFSAFLSLLTIILAYLICHEITGRISSSLLAALLTSISPEFLFNSPVIGVDIVMSFFCMAGTYAALKVYKHFSLKGLAITGILCGLAVSSKYNALPIAVLPLALCLGLKHFKPAELLTAAITPALGFFLGSPFILVSIPMFLDHLSYEMWHYGVAGHVGHTAEPGIDQALFYANWMVTDGLGWLASLIALAGLALLRTERKKEAALFLLYPTLFAALMIGQKANFTRNMISIIPFIAVLTAAGYELILKRLVSDRMKFTAAFWIGAVFLCFQPLIGSLRFNRDLKSAPESRKAAAEWLTSKSQTASDIAIAGKLLFPTAIYRLPGMSRVDSTKETPASLYQAGFNYFVAGPETEFSPEMISLLAKEKEFEGVDEKQRIINNPKIEVYRFEPEAEEFVRAHQENTALVPRRTLGISDGVFTCANENGESVLGMGEDYCWMSSRLSVLSLKGAKSPVTLEVMTPWASQKLKFQTKDWSFEFDFSGTKLGEWNSIALPLPAQALRDNADLLLQITEVHSPAARKLSADTRRLGVAVKISHS
jgi:hypothetical protein